MEIRGSCHGKEPMSNKISDGGATVPCISLLDHTSALHAGNDVSAT